MTLEQIKAAYLAGELSALKVTRRLVGVKEQLDELYPGDIPFIGKMYMYINGLDMEQVVCSRSGKSKSFAGIVKGFRQYCGSPDKCACNMDNINTGWKNKSASEIEAINLKRKKTVRTKYGVDSVSQLDEIKLKAEQTCYGRYGTKSPTQNPDILEKSRKTCRQNHGVDYPQQSGEIYRKTTGTFMEKYGVSRPAQDTTVQAKMKATMVSRYGVESPMHIKDIVTKVTEGWRKFSYADVIGNRSGLIPLFTVEEYGVATASDLLLWECSKCGLEFYETVKDTAGSKCPTCNPKHKTWGEITILEWLKEAGVEVVEGAFNVIPPLQLDFYMPKLNLAVEFNGIYWHSELAGRGKNYHLDKFKKCREAGIKLIQIFEHELAKNETVIRDRIHNAVGLINTKIGARTLELIEVDSKTAREFYNNNHLQGNLQSKINYGLIKNGILYSVMSFSKSRFSSKAEWELTRFATLNGVSVSGAASRLFKHFTKIVNPRSVVSYADLKWGEGTVYKHLGFHFQHYSQPNYWYFKNINDVHSRVKFQKHKLPQELHHLGSEWVIMRHLGWNRFWDCGNAVWLWVDPA